MKWSLKTADSRYTKQFNESKMLAEVLKLSVLFVISVKQTLMSSFPIRLGLPNREGHNADWTEYELGRAAGWRTWQRHEVTQSAKTPSCRAIHTDILAESCRIDPFCGLQPQEQYALVDSANDQEGNFACILNAHNKVWSRQCVGKPKRKNSCPGGELFLGEAFCRNTFEQI